MQRITSNYRLVATMSVFYNGTIWVAIWFSSTLSLPLCGLSNSALTNDLDCRVITLQTLQSSLMFPRQLFMALQCTPCPNGSDAKIQMGSNTICTIKNKRHFDNTNYYLFKVNYTSFNKIHILVLTISSRVKLPVQEIGYHLYSQHLIKWQMKPLPLIKFL